MIRAPKSASTRVHIGAATACSMATTVTPAKGADVILLLACASHHHSAVDRQHLSGAVRRGIRCHENERPRHLLGSGPPLQRNTRHHVGRELLGGRNSLIK